MGSWVSSAGRLQGQEWQSGRRTLTGVPGPGSGERRAALLAVRGRWEALSQILSPGPGRREPRSPLLAARGRLRASLASHTVTEEKVPLTASRAQWLTRRSAFLALRDPSLATSSTLVYLHAPLRLAGCRRSKGVRPHVGGHHAQHSLKAGLQGLGGAGLGPGHGAGLRHGGRLANAR